MKIIGYGKNRKIWMATAILLVFAAALLVAARRVPGFAEWYGQIVYPGLVATIGRVMGWFPFSMAEVGLYGVGTWAVWTLISNWKHPMIVIRRYSLLLAVILFLYAACCGVNYYRTPFSYYYMKQHADGREYAADGRDAVLKELCLWLTERVNEAREELDGSVGMYENLPEKGIRAMTGLAETYPALAGYYPQAKPVLVSGILSVQQCSGVYSPFTVEANYNRAMASYNIPHTICHEMSHLRGFMREDEANFIGYLACLESEDADCRYSGYLLGWIYAGNALAKVDYEEYVKNYGMLSEKIREDLDGNHEFWEQYEGTAAEVQERVNDVYLKVNGQAEGVRTYGRVVDLMVLDFQYRR